MLRGQHHEAKSCSFTTGVTQGGDGRGSRFSRLHHEARFSTGLAATGTEASFVSFVVSTTKQSRAPSAAADHQW